MSRCDWGVLPDGRRIPLHRGLTFYRVMAFDNVTNTYAIEAVEGGAVRAGHHRLCPNVANFRSDAAKKPASGG